MFDRIKLLPRDTCESNSTFKDEDMPARISAVFVVFALSSLGSFFPLIAKHCSFLRLPSWVFFITRYFGSGVIVATGFIHLLAEADEALTDECLGGVYEEYPWAEGIALMGVFVMFFLDVLAHKKIEQKVKSKCCTVENIGIINRSSNEVAESDDKKSEKNEIQENAEETKSKDLDLENFYAQILNSFVLEFGIIFHSVFVGLSLSIAGDEFRTLYAAICFHQMFEGLGLGTRFATTPWPEDKSYTPWVLSLAYSLTTPIAIAIGLGVRKSYAPNSAKALVVTGAFDAACAGVLIYNSLVELMAYDFMYSTEFKGENDGMKKTLFAFTCLTLGAFGMAIIGKWA